MAIEVKENKRLDFNLNNKKSNLIKTLISSENDDRKDEIEIELIDGLTTFEHPFEKSIDTGIEELAESIKASGLWQPIIVRRKKDGRYEILAGHRRTKASKLAGEKYIKAIIKDCDDDTAKLIVTETNTHQREEIFPSERAKAYRIQMEALKNQGKRNDLIKAVQEEINFRSIGPEVDLENNNNFGSNGPKVKYARDVVAEINNTSAKEVSRYLRLNELIEPLLNLVDDKTIPIRAAVELSYLDIKDQLSLASLIERNSEIKITIALAEELRAASKEMELNEIIIEATINPPAEDKFKDFKVKPQKPVYKTAFKGVEKYIKKLDVNKAEKLALADAEELENRIKETIESYIESL